MEKDGLIRYFSPDFKENSHFFQNFVEYLNKQAKSQNKKEKTDG
jgi:hypothetical protein